MARDPWGGTLEITTMAADDDAEADEDLDRAALIWRQQQQQEEATRRGWLLHAADEKKRKKRHVDLWCMTVDRNTLLWTAGVVILVGSVATVARLVPRGPSPPPRHPDRYTQALHQALVFFNAQRSGPLPKDNGGVGWRGDSGMEDGLASDRRRSLVGGYYDGGGAVKLSFPMAWSMTMLSWTVLEYGAKYDAIGELEHVKDLVRWGTDYLFRTFDSSATNHAVDLIIAQVGDSSECWMRPEDMDSTRPVYECGACSDIAREMAAALAAASIVFKDDDDGRYSGKLLHGAEKLYKFGTQQPGRYSGSDQPAALLYNSSGYQDEMLWGGAWMYMATGNTSYLPSVPPPLAGAPRVFSWDDKLRGSQLLLSRLRLLLSPGYPYEEMLSRFHAQNDNAMCSYLPVFKSFNFTKGGLIQLNHGRPRPLQYTVNAAFLASLYAGYLDTTGTPGWNCGPDFYTTQALRDFARSQLDYILGKNPLNMSYVVGFGNKYPKHVHHRGASIPYDGVKYGCKGGAEWKESKKANPNIILGAMVAGPDRHDGFKDVRGNYNYTEPSLAANAGLVAALISLADVDTAGKSSGVDKNTIFSAIPPMFANPPPPPPAWEPTF